MAPARYRVAAGDTLTIHGPADVTVEPGGEGYRVRLEVAPSWERLAYHEAGHAAAALLLGCAVHDCWIRPPDGYTGYAMPDAAPDAAEGLITVAGPLAQGIYQGDTPAPDHPEIGGLESHVREATAMLQSHWPLVEQLAVELIADGRLSRSMLRHLASEHASVALLEAAYHAR